MRNALFTLIPVGLAVFTAPPACAQKTSANTNVTTVVHDNSASGARLLMRSDDYNGTGQATYTTVPGSSPTRNLIDSMIDGTGAWKLNLFNQSLRTLWITPDSGINASQPAGPPPGYYWQNVEAHCRCYDQNLNQVPLPNLVNGSDHCSLGVDFYSGGTKYKLVMSPRLPAAGPATGLASVACGAVSGGQCVSWTITPNTTAPNAAVANLYRYSSKGSLVFVGQYYNTYRIIVSNP